MAETVQNDETFPTVLFVGGFPKNLDIVKGGQVSACDAIIKSPLSKHINLILLDTTQITVPPPGFLIRLKYAFFRLIKYFKIFTISEVDAVIIFSAERFSFLEKSLMSIIAKMLGKGVIFSVRSGYFRDDCSKAWWKVLSKIGLSFSDKIICQGKNWIDFYIKVLGIKPEKCAVIPNFIEVGKYNVIPPENLRENDKFVFMFAGWIEKEKGIYEIIEAYQMAGKKLINCEFHFCGTGNELDKIKEIVISYGLNEKIKFFGWLNKNELIDKMRNSNALVLPSYSEGFPNVVLEAMVVGIPVITTPVGAIPDYLENNVHAILVKPKDAKSLSKAFVDIFKDDKLRENLIMNSKEIIYKVFSSETAWQDMAKIINEVLVVSGSSKRIKVI